MHLHALPQVVQLVPDVTSSSSKLLCGRSLPLAWAVSAVQCSAGTPETTTWPCIAKSNIDGDLSDMASKHLDTANHCLIRAHRKRPTCSVRLTGPSQSVRSIREPPGLLVFTSSGWSGWTR